MSNGKVARKVRGYYIRGKAQGRRERKEVIKIGNEINTALSSGEMMGHSLHLSTWL